MRPTNCQTALPFTVPAPFEAGSAAVSVEGGLFGVHMGRVPSIVPPDAANGAATDIASTSSRSAARARPSALSDAGPSPKRRAQMGRQKAGRPWSATSGTKSLAFKTLPTWAKSLYSHAQVGARKRDLSFALSPKQFAFIVQRAAGRCEISGIPFELDGQKGRRRPFAPSLDRIDSSLGYAGDNCRLVCALANVAMNEWGLQPVIRFAFALTQNSIAAQQHQHKVKLHGIPTGPGSFARPMRHGAR